MRYRNGDIMEINENRLPIVEALIISSPEPLPSRKIADVAKDITPSQVDQIIGSLNEKYQELNTSFRIRKIAGGYQMYILDSYAGFVNELFTRRRTAKLSRAGLETLAIISYRQPVIKADIELIRGVSSDSAIHTLLQKKLITLAGRAKSLGRPLLYATTGEFLKYFNLNSLDDLPRMEEIEELLAADEPDVQESLGLEEGKKEAAQDSSDDLENDDDDKIYATVDSSSSDEPIEHPPETLTEEEEQLAQIIDEAVDKTLSVRAESDEFESNQDSPVDIIPGAESLPEETETADTAEEETVQK